MEEKFEEKNNLNPNKQEQLDPKISPLDTNIIKKIGPYICKVYNSKIDYENGFLCKIPYPCRDSYIHVLITSNKIYKIKLIMISFENDKIKKFIYHYPERIIYKSEKYNLQFIQIFPDKDDLHNFLEFEEDIINKDKINLKNMNVCIPYYSNNENLSVNIGKINNYIIDDSISKEDNSGYPLILLNSFKIIGISFNKKEDNFLLFKKPILEFIKNEIIIKVSIGFNDTNRKIYILNNPFSGNIYGEEVNEINSSNTIMYINDERCEFQKYKIFSEKGLYTIKLKLNFF